MCIRDSYYEKHKNPDYLKKFIYGLTEIFKEQIKNKKFISCPGCYPTSILLPLIPILKAKDIIVTDWKSKKINFKNDLLRKCSVIVARDKNIYDTAINYMN